MTASRSRSLSPGRRVLRFSRVSEHRPVRGRNERRALTVLAGVGLQSRKARDEYIFSGFTGTMHVRIAVPGCRFRIESVVARHLVFFSQAR